MTSPVAHPQARAIGTVNESPLHAGLKSWYARRGDRMEVPLEGHQIDLVRGRLLVEIQTRRLGALRRKLTRLLDEHPVEVIHPVAAEKWIVRTEGDELRVLGRRKSPQRGRLEHAFEELVSLSTLLKHPNLHIQIVLTREEEVRRREAGRCWRRHGWTIVERRLLSVASSHMLRGRRDLLRLLPGGLPDAFTTADLASGLEISRPLAQKMTYCLHHAGALEITGKRGNARVYRRCAGPR